jgi:hypothetical protein
MGAILSDLTELPAAEGPETRKLYRRIYDELAELSEAPPAQPDNTITPAQLKAALQAVIGQRIKDEIANDPRNLNYAGKTDVQQAAILNDPFSLLGKRIQGIPILAIIAPLSNTVLKVQRSGGGAVDLLPFGLNLKGKAVRFRGNTTTVALAGVSFVIDATNGDTITLAGVGLTTPAVLGDTLIVEETDPTVFANRLHQILRRIPHAPNVVTTADVANAKL